MAVFGSTTLAVGALFMVTSALGAQAAAKPACDVSDAPKGNTAKATLFVNQAREASTPILAATHLKTAVKLVESPEKGDDAVGRAYVLGSALSLWANQPGVGMTPKRSLLGFSTSPDAQLDLVGAIDSLFKVVETAKPDCSDFTSYWRAGQKFYLDIVNGAINSLNAANLDSAEYYATQANRLYSVSPYGSMVLGSVASKRGNNAKALEYWTTTVAAASKDTSYRDVQRQTLASIGSAHMNTANTASGAEKMDAARKAAAIYSALIAVPGTRGTYLSFARQNVQQAYLMVGDTGSFVKSYEDQLANPTVFEYQDLLNSAVNAARANRAADAAKLFESTLVLNPLNRDALYNLAFTYLTLEQNEKVVPVVTRLVAVDPGNPENFNLAARAYLALAKAAEKAKKSPVAAAYNDSTVNWFSKGNALGVEVTFTEFSPSDKQVVIGGTVVDRREKSDANAVTPPARGKAGARPAGKPAAKIYPPKAVTLKFDALDKDGAVVGTETTITEPLTPGKTARFTVTVTAPNVLAYRYTIIN